jgi:hypothetical protein
MSEVGSDDGSRCWVMMMWIMSSMEFFGVSCVLKDVRVFIDKKT